MNSIRENRVLIAWILTLVGVLGSLYLSEILHWIPCNLCWAERIALFPLALLLLIPAYQSDNNSSRYFAILPAAGALISLVHIATLSGVEIPLCGQQVNCKAPLQLLFGSTFSAPILSLTLFLLIFATLMSKNKLSS